MLADILHDKLCLWVKPRRFKKNNNSNDKKKNSCQQLTLHEEQQPKLLCK